MGKLTHKLETTKSTDSFELRHILAYNIRTHSLRSSQRNLNLFIVATGYVCMIFVSSSIHSALFDVSSNSVLFLVNSALKINQLNINL